MDFRAILSRGLFPEFPTAKSFPMSVLSDGLYTGTLRFFGRRIFDFRMDFGLSL
jgi:hypothetical protein